LEWLNFLRSKLTTVSQGVAGSNPASGSDPDTSSNTPSLKRVTAKLEKCVPIHSVKSHFLSHWQQQQAQLDAELREKEYQSPLQVAKEQELRIQQEDELRGIERALRRERAEQHRARQEYERECALREKAEQYRFRQKHELHDAERTLRRENEERERYERKLLRKVEREDRIKVLFLEELCSYSIESDIQSSNSNSSLSRSESDSEYSDDEIEYEDALGFDPHNYSGVLGAMCDESLLGTAKGEERLLQPVFGPLKQAIIEHVMKEFWVIFNQQWSMNVRKCNGGGSEPIDGASNSSSSRDSSKQGEKKNKDKSKRERGSNDDQRDGSDQEGNFKRTRGSNEFSKDRKSNEKFACPYRKHNSQKYSVHNWRVCALSPLNSVSRVKSGPPKLSI